MRMSTIELFKQDAYLSTCEATITHITDDGGILLDQTCFYAHSGGQPGDVGFFEQADGTKLAIANTIYGPDKTQIIHILDGAAPSLSLGETLVLHIDWPRRYKLMRMHTACHLLSVVCPYPVTGAAVGEQESRIDFDMTQAPDKTDISRQLQALVQDNHPIFTKWISESELDAKPDLVKSKNVRPPRGLGDIRLVCIGEDSLIDSQPCGGTHVSETQEVGDIHVGKIEKKGKQNRRFRIRFGKQPDDSPSKKC